MNLLEALRSGAASVLQKAKVFGHSFVLSNRARAARFEVASLEADLAKLEQVSDTFTTRTGQTVEAREVVDLRKLVAAHRLRLAALEAELEARRGVLRYAAQR